MNFENSTEVSLGNVAEWFIAHAWKACTGVKTRRKFKSCRFRQRCYDIHMANLFVGEIVGNLGKNAKNRKWRSWVVVQAPFDMSPEKFNEIVLDLHPEDYLMYDEHEELAWNHDHSGALLIRAFKEHGYELYTVESADLVYMFPDRNW